MRIQYEVSLSLSLIASGQGQECHLNQLSTVRYPGRRRGAVGAERRVLSL